MRKNLSVLLMFLSILIISSCKKDNNDKLKQEDPTSNATVLKYLNSNRRYGSITDLDGNKYATIKIGNQNWMAENLRTTQYNDSTPIKQISDISAPPFDYEEAYYIYNNDMEIEAIYGKLYNWYAVNTGKLCPKGWHVPTEAEWNELVNYLGGLDSAGQKMKSIGTIEDSTGLWYKNEDTEGTNSSGFTAFPGGVLDTDGSFHLGYFGNWWNAVEIETADATINWNLYFYVNNISVSYAYDKRVAVSCRCIED